MPKKIDGQVKDYYLLAGADQSLFQGIVEKCAMEPLPSPISNLEHDRKEPL